MRKPSCYYSHVNVGNMSLSTYLGRTLLKSTSLQWRWRLSRRGRDTGSSVSTFELPWPPVTHLNANSPLLSNDCDDSNWLICFQPLACVVLVNTNGGNSQLNLSATSSEENRHRLWWSSIAWPTALLHRIGALVSWRPRLSRVSPYSTFRALNRSKLPQVYEVRTKKIAPARLRGP